MERGFTLILNTDLNYLPLVADHWFRQAGMIKTTLKSPRFIGDKIRF